VHLQWRLRERGFILHDTQWTTPHLAQFGGHEIPGARYLDLLARAIRLPVSFDDRPVSFPLVLR
jgi:leucyl/phenylalanyl-tRNA--protein transferase